MLPHHTIDKEREAGRGSRGKYLKEWKPGFKVRAFCVDVEKDHERSEEE